MGLHPVAIIRTHLHKENTQNNAMKQNTENRTCIAIKIHKPNNKNT